MTILRTSSLFLALAAGAFAQDGLVATAARTLTIPPTDTIVQASVRTDSTKTLDDVLAKVKALGLTIENLASITTIAAIASPVTGVPGVAGSSIFTFRITVPIPDSTGTLQKIQQFSTANADYRTDASVTGVTASLASIQDAQRQAFPDMYKEAKARASQMADGAGLSVGKVLSVAETYQYLTSTIITSVQVPYLVSIRVAID